MNLWCYSGAIAMNQLWNDNSDFYSMYHPVCSGNETNILSCHYSTTNLVPSRSLCRTFRYRNYADETSVVCLPGTVISWILNSIFQKLHSDGQIEPTTCEDGEVRLFGELPYRGRVEICKGSVWGSVCSSYGFSNSDATVICRMLGYQPDYTIGEINL